MEIPYTVASRRDTGLYNAKVGIWLFLASEVMLFGGLFSGYVFLRTGVQPGLDVPWPSSAEVHGKYVWLGFTNTLVLIASSVFVVMAWAQLKLRNWGGYKMYMWLVLICSLAFLGIKTIEYNSKFNHHFGVRLTDGTLIDGALIRDEEHDCEGDVVTFNAKKATFSMVPTGMSQTPDPYILDFAKNPEELEFDLQLMEPVEDDNGILKFEPGEVVKASTNEVAGVLSAERLKLAKASDENFKKRRKELEQKLRDTDEYNAREDLKTQLIALNPTSVPNIVGTVTDPEGAIFQFKRKDAWKRNLGQDRIAFYRENAIEGEMIDDKIDLNVHMLDLQMVPNDADSMAWEILGDGFKAGYEHHKQEVMEKYKGYVEKGGVIPADHIRQWRHAHPLHEHGGEAAGHGDHSENDIAIEESDIKFSGSHGPAFGPYFAIYFTMTGLHGLHVIGGALVLGYFLFFGKKLYLKNPEHLANRVEVGGLFWHFVDLVWIFLFPIFYLM